MRRASETISLRGAPASSASRKYTFTVGNREFEAGNLCERLKAGPETETLDKWSNCFLEGEPILTRRRHVDGHVYYLGTSLSETLAEALSDHIAKDTGS